MSESLNNEELSTINELRAGDTAVLTKFFDRHRDALKRMASFRIDPRVTRRLDESDVVQEAYINYFSQVDRYVQDPRIPPEAWLRRLMRQVLFRLNRDHIDAQCRDVRREDDVYFHSTINIEQLTDSLSSVGSKIDRLELRNRLMAIVSQMSPLDCEILMLVHFEERTLRQAAVELEIQLEAAKKRYRRALQRLRVAYESDIVGFLK